MVAGKRVPGPRRMLPALLVAVLTHAPGASADQVTQAMTVKAAITPGCWFGSSQSPVTSLGVIDFGTVYRLDKSVKTKSTVSAGSIVMRCTPGTTFRVDINEGSNATRSSFAYSGRQLKSAAGKVLKYELYQDSGYLKRWGQNNDGVLLTATSSAIDLTVYAELRSTQAMPEPGLYTDDLIVTVYY
ncbi:hypothetical protein DDE05_30370 [Streptomyces cavourensis]|nr:hypothetical protein DDE05_30370 [Streptomyces cavourensis]